MRQHFPLTACLLAIIFLFGIASASSYASIQIKSPSDGRLIQHTSGKANIDVIVSASDVPLGGGIEIVLDEGTAIQRKVAYPASSDQYYHSFEAVSYGEHKIDAYIVQFDNTRIAHDEKRRIGVGDIVVALGDSITRGEVDDIYTDNWSADGRNGPQIDPYTGEEFGGFEPILNDLLTQARRYPHSVINEGVSGETTHDVISRLNDVINRNHTAKTWLISYGTNDTNRDMSPEALKANLIEIITQIQMVIPGSSVYLSKVFHFSQSDEDRWRIPYYHNVMGEIVRSMPNVYWGADIYTVFNSNDTQFPNHGSELETWFATTRTHHPNGVGIQKIAMLWKRAIVDNAILVSDGYFSDLGGLSADSVKIDGVNSVGASNENLFLARSIMPQSIPKYVSVPGTGWRFELTKSPGFNGGAVVVTAKVWNKLEAHLSQVNFLLDSVPVDTASWEDSPGTYCFQTILNRPGQLVLVYPKPCVLPVTTCTLNPRTPNGLNGWYVTRPRIVFNVTSECPYDAIYYKWDSSAARICGREVLPLMGKHTLYYWACNSAGAETSKSIVLKVDPTPPSTPYLPTDTLYAIAESPVTLGWTCYDNESGIDKYLYAIGTTPGGIDVKGWTSTTAKSLTFTPKGPVGTTYYASVRAKNRAGTYSMVGQSGPVIVGK